ncbi:GNAT family N-acetyltransferase [Paenalkalicoccus suaedae]|uniref:GNAT family N-acetyltransferase n=1 Tax=Paenalkalicoccus suaedae TaxID=2592382 RepID=A0A859FBQ6_9BACI|nr:GNAT family N-acetyltransferase [Paenalkalicoccus suaedae]QKS70699.1 GNAT family N-acetyltransferase [Paenalkalicoccus suaedae]
MQFKEYSHAKDVLARVGPMLEKREVQHNLPLGVLRQLERERDPDCFLAVGERDGEPVSVMIQTPPRKLIICGKQDAMKETAEWMYQVKPDLNGVIGCSDSAEAFTRAWTEISGAASEPVRRQVIFRLDKVKEFDRPQGKLTYANEDDFELVMSWTEEFALGSMRASDLERLEETVMQEIKHNQVFLWRDQYCTPVSMAKRARELTNGIVVNYVYTPEEYERQGFATACVGALSERLLKEGYRFCSVNTNDDHEASQSVYKKLGYEPVGSAIEFSYTTSVT